MKPLFTPDRKKVIFFDLNGTLVRSQRAFSSCFRDVLDEFSGRWDKESEGWDKDKILSSYLRKWSDPKERHSARGNPDIRRRAALQAALKPFPIAVNDSFARRFFSRLRQLQTSQSELLPDVAETLAFLSERYKIAVISNGSKDRQAAILQKWNLHRYIPEQHLFSSQQHKRGKPNPAIFRDALARMGIRPAQAVMVGDSLKNDIYGATRVGMDAVWIHPDGGKNSQRRIGREKMITIRKFGQLRQLF